jgi:glycosyltransferase involved in cell wall biosynthesis
MSVNNTAPLAPLPNGNLPSSPSLSSSRGDAHDIDPCNIAIITTWAPRMCGIATFSEALRNGLLSVCPSSSTSRVDVIAVRHRDQPPAEYNETEVKYTFREYEVLDYVETAQYINKNNYHTVLIQYEYGMLYGDNLICFLRELSVPNIITTLHTVHVHLDENIHAWVQQVAFLSTKIVVMTHSMRHSLSVYHAIPTRDIAVIPHGGPDLPYQRYDDPTYHLPTPDSREGEGEGKESGIKGKQKLYPGKKIIFSNGLIHPMKGIEYVIRAMPRILQEIPNAMYLIHGRPHPSGTGCEEYYEALQKEANEINERMRMGDAAVAPPTADVGETESVILFNRSYAHNDDLYFLLQHARVYVNAYIDEGQSVSGTLAMALSLGTVAVSTPYSYAIEMLLRNNTGKLIPFRHVDALADAIIEVLRDDELHEEMSQKAYQAAQSQTWKKVAKGYLKLTKQR